MKSEAENIYSQMTSYSNYSEMNGISKDWFIECIEKGLNEYAMQEAIEFKKWSDYNCILNEDLKKESYEELYRLFQDYESKNQIMYTRYLLSINKKSNGG
jgi:hypothetical protein